ICVKAICISGSDTTSSADTCIEVRTTVGINDISLASGVKLYPNPASDQLTIEMESRFNTVEVINTLGQVVYRADLIDKKKVIDVTDYSAGMYYVKLQGDAGMVTRKFVKK
ncbi:MAG: T9SS type A sorting domain-containing protein, partial [Bacteroidales bacterium]|nr:T9SS type A sorting domain-containing protein [Bacteroidales bacterium]